VFLRGFMYWVYIVQNSVGKCYVGHSDNLELRVHSHNRTDRILGKFARKSGPWQLVWKEAHATRSWAMRREREIKGMKSARWIRENLLNGRVPTGRD